MAMPFKGPEWSEVYSAIRRACKALYLQSIRVDEYKNSGIVIRDIALLIEEAEFIVFDLSLERPNVYYELGYAHGVGNEANDILLVAQVGTVLHYDIAGLRVEFYTTMEELEAIVREGLAARIRATR